MMRGFDFSSWQSILSTLIGIALITLIGMGIRLLVMMAVQQRRERMNRQINERLKTLIAAYKVLGGSFTGSLEVNPAHLRDRAIAEEDPDNLSPPESPGAERGRRIRDAVEGALSDIILLGTDEQVRLAEHAARELVAGRRVETHDLVVSLRDFIRKALDLSPIPADLNMLRQGPSRPSSGSGGKGGGAERGGRGGGGGMGGGMGGGGGGGGGMGLGMGLGLGHRSDDATP